MIKQEIKNIKESPKDLKNFGLTIGTVLILIALFLFYKEKQSAYWFISIGVLLVLAGLLYPLILRPLNKAWMILAVLMGWVMTRVILSILFFLVLTPTSFLAKLFGKQFLNLKRKKNSDSYWDKRKEVKFTPDYYEKQF